MGGPLPRALRVLLRQRCSAALTAASRAAPPAPSAEGAATGLSRLQPLEDARRCPLQLPRRCLSSAVSRGGAGGAGTGAEELRGCEGPLVEDLPPGQAHVLPLPLQAVNAAPLVEHHHLAEEVAPDPLLPAEPNPPHVPPQSILRGSMQAVFDIKAHLPATAATEPLYPIGGSPAAPPPPSADAEPSGKAAAASSTESRSEDAWIGGLSTEVRQLAARFEEAKACLQRVPERLSEVPTMDPHAVYANKNLRLDRISVYGFDYDYTIAHYTENLQPLIYSLALNHLVKEYRYPRECLQFKYDPSFPIRGLYYDMKTGYLLKLDFFHCVEPGSSYFGRRQVPREEIERAYGGLQVPAGYMHNLASLMDLFCLSEACLISDVIHHFVQSRIEFDPMYVYEDVKNAINYVHRSGLMHRAVLLDPSSYLLRQAGVISFLQRLKSSGKKVFLLTNSPFFFVNGGMQFLFQEDGQGGDTWRSLFDVVVALADKPNFYHSERPFRYYHDKRDSLTWRKVSEFKPGAIYYHGCLKDFLAITGYVGQEVLYFGDHLYSDLRGPMRAGWRTAAIIRELESDVATQNSMGYRLEQAKYHTMQELVGNFHMLSPEQRSPADQAFLAAVQAARAESRAGMKGMFNAHFGSCFLTDRGKESAFAYNVQRYADVYTSKLENFLKYRIDSWLYAPHNVKILPHNVKVEPSSLLCKS